MQSFLFSSTINELIAEDTLILEVPKHQTNKGMLLAWYAKALHLPEDFGANWDALDDCLRDLSWIKERKLIFFHQDIPLKPNPNEQKVYLNLLATVIRDWKPGETHEVVVAFHPTCELMLRAALRGA